MKAVWIYTVYSLVVIFIAGFYRLNIREIDSKVVLSPCSQVIYLEVYLLSVRLHGSWRVKMFLGCSLFQVDPDLSHPEQFADIRLFLSCLQKTMVRSAKYANCTGEVRGKSFINNINTKNPDNTVKAQQANWYWSNNILFFNAGAVPLNSSCESAHTRGIFGP